MTQIETIRISRLEPHPQNPRKALGDLTELAESIRANGIFQNLTAVPVDMEAWGRLMNFHGNIPDTVENYEGAFRVVIGHRRLAAAKEAGLTEVPCAVAVMTPVEQVRTMLMENVQRSDLTPLEQAQGFQMMLDMGDSVDDIVRGTGFSETTVRRRVKMMELDAEKVEAAMERGATIADYDALNKIKDIKRRNKVLDDIGTREFDWALKSALREETRAENKPKVLAILDTFATKLKKGAKTSSYDRIFYSVSLDKPEFEIPKDAGKRKYYYIDDGTSIPLYAERQKTKAPKKPQHEVEREERVRALKDLFLQAYELRLAFARGYKAVAKHADLIDKMAIGRLFRDYYSADCDVFRALYGIDAKFRKSWESADKGESFEEAVARLVTDNGETNSTMLFRGVYCAMEESGHKCVTYTGSHEADEQLDALYAFLTKVGYAMSAEEQALLDGTHELYKKEG